MEILLLQYVYDGKNTNTAITLFYTIFICHNERKITQKNWTKKTILHFSSFFMWLLSFLHEKPRKIGDKLLR